MAPGGSGLVVWLNGGGEVARSPSEWMWNAGMDFLAMAAARARNADSCACSLLGFEVLDVTLHFDFLWIRLRFT